VIRKRLPNGKQVADHEIAEHATSEALMREVLRARPDTDAFPQLLAKLVSDVRQHLHEEEAEIFPMVREACDPTMLLDLGTRALTAKKLAPTRPHPKAPDTPPLNKVAAPVVGLIDRAADV